MNNIYENLNIIKKLIVNLDYNNGKASGVLIDLKAKNSKIFGVITVKHLFISNKDLEFSKDTENVINNEISVDFITYCLDEGTISITVENSINTKLLTNKVFIFKDHDIALLVIETEEEVNLPTLRVYNQSILPSDTLYIAGFSNYTERLLGKKICNIYDASLFEIYNESDLHLRYKNGALFTYHNTGDFEKNFFGIVELIVGMSGGGVFIIKNEKYYLVGIQKKAAHTDRFIATDLNFIYKILNELINVISKEPFFPDPIKNIEFESEIKLTSDSVDIRDFDKIVEFILKDSEDFSNKYTNEKTINAAKQKFEKDMASQQNLLQEIAKNYLYFSYFHRKNLNYRKMLNTLKVATKLNPEYETLLIVEKNNRTNTKEKTQMNILEKEKNNILNSQGKEKLASLMNIESILASLGDGYLQETLFYNIQIIKTIFIDVELNPEGYNDIINRYKNNSLCLINKIYKADDLLEEKTLKIAEVYFESKDAIEAYKCLYILNEFLKITDETDSEKYQIISNQLAEIMDKIENGSIALSASELIKLHKGLQPKIDELLRVTGKNKIWSIKQDLKKLTLENQKLHEELQQYKHNQGSK